MLFIFEQSQFIVCMSRHYDHFTEEARGDIQTQESQTRAQN